MSVFFSFNQKINSRFRQVDIRVFEKLDFDKFNFGECDLDEVTFGRIEFGELVYGKFPFCKLAGGKLDSANWTVIFLNSFLSSHKLSELCDFFQSTVCKRIMEKLGQTGMTQRERQVVCISQDSFYKELTPAEKNKAVKGQFNFDHPGTKFISGKLHL